MAHDGLVRTVLEELADSPFGVDNGLQSGSTRRQRWLNLHLAGKNRLVDDIENVWQQHLPSNPPDGAP